LEHLLDAINYLIRHRDSGTGLVRALYGDWNDAIDGLGVSSDGSSDFGSGVSIMVSLQLYQNCSEMLEILVRYRPGSFLEQRAQLQQVQAALREALLQHAVETRSGERRIVHGWGDHRAFTVGGFQDADGLSRDGLTSNAFWVLAGMLDAEPSLRSDILQAFRRLDSKYGLRTFAPGFGPTAEAIGRINRLPIGTAENGATYVHATTFAIAALFRMGEPEFAWEQLRKILPFGAHLVDPSHSPFVMPNSYAENLELNLDGQSMNDWQTGSSNVLLKLLIRYVCGLDVRLNHLQIAPARWSPFTSLHCAGRVHGHQIDITVQRGDVAERKIRHNGKHVEPLHFDQTSQISYAKIPLEAISQTEAHSFVVTDPY
jgi:cellobiose phosphorylase